MQNGEFGEESPGSGRDPPIMGNTPGESTGWGIADTALTGLLYDPALQRNICQPQAGCWPGEADRVIQTTGNQLFEHLRGIPVLVMAAWAAC